MCKQTRPPRGRKTTLEEAPRIATIHEYLDWTVTAEDALGEHDLVLPRISYLILLPVHHDPQRQSHSFGRRLREGCKFQTYSEMQILLSNVSVCHGHALHVAATDLPALSDRNLRLHQSQTSW